MKEWYSAAELTKIQGLPNTKPGIIKMATREQWKLQERKGKGGGYEYHISSLPAPTQKSLRISHAKLSASYAKGAQTAEELKAAELQREKERLQRLDQGLRDYMKLRGKARDRSDAKQEIVIAFEDFCREAELNGTTARKAFTQAYVAGEIQLPEWVHAKHKTFSEKSLYNWVKKYNNEGAAALAGKFGGHRKGTGIIDTQSELSEYIIGMIVEYPHIKVAVLHKAMLAEFYNQTTTLPSKTSLERWVGKWKEDNKQVYTAVTNPDAWKNKFMAAPGDASERATGLNVLWEFDATPADMMLTDGRHSLSGVIDVYSRRLKLLVTRTANSKAVAQVIRESILDWGVPAIAKTDNGADYKSTYIKTVIKRLEIDQEFCRPFCGWEKPHIERAFRTFSHDIAELLPGFIGHNVGERKAIEARKAFSDRLFEKDTLIDVKMNSSELQEFCNNWVDNIYHRDPHSGLNGKTPLEMVRNWSQPIRMIDDERILDVLLSEPAGTRTITKKGIKVDNGLYIHGELWARAGEEVHVYYDERDMGRVYVYDTDGEFICIAEDPAVTGVSRSEVAAKAKEVQREAVQEERRRLKSAARKVTKRDVAQDIIQHRIEEARKDKTIEFPKRTEQHTGFNIEAAKDALWTEGGSSQERFEESAPTAEQQLAEILPIHQSTQPKEETGQQVYERWLALERRVDTGETLKDQDALFFKTYQETAEFKTYSQLNEMGMLQLHG